MTRQRPPGRSQACTFAATWRGSRSRRQLLRLAGAAVAGGAGLALVNASPAGAADGGNMIIGQSNSATNPTNLASDYSGGFGYPAFSAYNSGDGGVGLEATGTGAVDIKLTGTGRLGQTSGSTGNAQPSFSPSYHELVRSDTGVVWASTDAGGWKRVNAVRVDNPNGAGTAFAPFRFVDTRTTAKLPFNVAKEYNIAGHANLPDDAVAVFGNITVVAPTVSGYIKLYPKGVTEPTVSSINFSANQTVGNFFFVGLGTGADAGKLLVKPGNNGNGQVHVIIDITAYVQ